MTVKHIIKGHISNVIPFMLNYLYEGGFTLEKYYNDRRFYPEVPSRQYLHRLDGEYLKITYKLYGYAYFTEAEYKHLYDQYKLHDWLIWAQESTGNYMDSKAIWKQAKINLHERLVKEE